jgi:DNA polymerase-3 subunit delta'
MRASKLPKMSFADFPEQRDVVTLLQRSLERGRLGHAYLFNGPDSSELEAVARTLAKTLMCDNPKRGAGLPLDCCDACLSCRKIEGTNHPDLLWVRPESRSRVITVDQMRDLMQTIYLKPTQAPFKVAVIVAADRLNAGAANAFLKTLEEPPSNSILVLLSTEPQRMLETILSRCLRLNFAGESQLWRDPALLAWLTQFSDAASSEQRGLLGRYKLLSILLNRFNETKERVTKALTERSPLERFDDVDPKLKEKWEEELEAAIESEYRRQRSDLLTGLQWWLRDVWLGTMRLGDELFTYPQLIGSARNVAQRLSSRDAVENLGLLEETQRLLAGNVQEALALEVGLLKLKL